MAVKGSGAGGRWRGSVAGVGGRVVDRGAGGPLGTRSFPVAWLQLLGRSSMILFRNLPVCARIDETHSHGLVSLQMLVQLLLVFVQFFTVFPVANKLLKWTVSFAMILQMRFLREPFVAIWAR